MPLEPINQLALAIQQYKGMFALLIGSGVSSAAGIKTGWEIVLDLIRHVAAAEALARLKILLPGTTKRSMKPPPTPK